MDSGLTEMETVRVIGVDKIKVNMYSGVPLKLDARVTRFMFSAAISKPLELKRSYMPL